MEAIQNNLTKREYFSLMILKKLAANTATINEIESICDNAILYADIILEKLEDTQQIE